VAVALDAEGLEVACAAGALAFAFGFVAGALAAAFVAVAFAVVFVAVAFVAFVVVAFVAVAFVAVAFWAVAFFDVAFVAGFAVAEPFFERVVVDVRLPDFAAILVSLT
jgi:hypothetical protein